MSTDLSVRRAPTSGSLRTIVNSAPVHIVALILLFSAAAWREATHLSILVSRDIWWHLSSGMWILQNHSAPHTGLFSQYSNLSWIDSNWLFDVLVAVAYKLLGLRGLPVFLMIGAVTIAVATFVLARGSRLNFWPAVMLSIAAQYIVAGSSTGPVACSITLFAVELTLLFDSRRTARIQPLFWLPLLFLIWANLDNGFLFGELTLLLFFAVVCSEELTRSGLPSSEQRTPTIPLRILAMITSASLVASLLTPYTFHLIGAASQEVWNAAPYVQDLRAMNFRQPRDYVLLLLAMLAFFAMGRRRSRDMFQIALMIGCLTLGFSRQRDTWLLALASVAIVADALPVWSQRDEVAGSKSLWRLEALTAAGLVTAAFIITVARIPGKGDALLAKVAETFPVGACDYIRANRLPAPLFNAYDWGGFLTWYLPDYPVAIDNRSSLYGDEITSRHFKLMIAAIPLNADPGFINAKTILLPKDSPMAMALSTLPQFKVVYQDQLATVLRQGE